MKHLLHRLKQGCRNLFVQDDPDVCARIVYQGFFGFRSGHRLVVMVEADFQLMNKSENQLQNVKCLELVFGGQFFEDGMQPGLPVRPALPGDT